MAIGMIPTKAFSENLGNVNAGMANGPKLASEFSEKEWSVTYRLFTEQGTVTEQKIVWELKKFN